MPTKEGRRRQAQGLLLLNLRQGLKWSYQLFKNPDCWSGRGWTQDLSPSSLMLSQLSKPEGSKKHHVFQSISEKLRRKHCPCWHLSISLQLLLLLSQFKPIFKPLVTICLTSMCEENPLINDRDQVLRAHETGHPNQILVFTKTAGHQPGWGHC